MGSAVFAFLQQFNRLLLGGVAIYSSCCRDFDLIFVQVMTFDISIIPQPGPENHSVDFIPIIRSGAWADIGNFRPRMEDVYICADNFMSDYGLKNAIDGPISFYGVLFSLS